MGYFVVVKTSILEHIEIASKILILYLFCRWAILFVNHKNKQVTRLAYFLSIAKAMVYHQCALHIVSHQSVRTVYHHGFAVYKKRFRTDDMQRLTPLHINCRCDILTMKSIRAGTATISGKNGADLLLKYDSKLPNYYITKEDAIKKGYHPILGNLSRIAPGKSITNGEYYNRNGHLPKADGRIWYEADINYKYGHRNSQRIIWSNDGLIFVTFDHYKTFFEIV